MSNPALPQVCLIHGRFWSIQYVDELHDKDGQELLGQCNADERIIRIAMGNEQMMRDTLLHEITHATLPNLSEKEVMAIEVLLGGTLLQNKPLRHYIFGD